VGAELGLSIMNPYIVHESKECAYAVLEDQCNTADVYQDQVIIGTKTNGLFSLSWNTVKAAGCAVDYPQDLTASIGTFTTFSGLLSQNIIAMEANGDYLGVVTSSGFCYGKTGEGSFLAYLTESGKDCYVCPDGSAFLAEGNRVLEQASPVDLVTWDREYNPGAEVNDIWVVQKDGINTLFAATESGIAVFEKDEEFYFGDLDYSQIKAEVGTTINHGHVFAVRSQAIDIINMQHKELENTIDYTGIALLICENKRIYSK
jgi:hypothetical protein